MNYEKIDIENWARKEHYRYYTEIYAYGIK